MIKNNENYKTKKVYVLNINGQPLMPCRIIKARHLLKSKKAKIVKYEPFTIQLLFECENKTQSIILGIDSGSKEVGLSAVGNDKELYSAEVKIRGNEIVKLLSERKQYRRSRRNRKTRYREPRFDNRKRKDGWLAPSIRSKIEAHKRQIEKVNKILPITKTIIEVASFDIQKIKNPTIEGKDYQQGEMEGWNVREYVLWRDNHQCQGRSKCRNKILNTHHIESRQFGGNAPNNLITLCVECHKDYHSGKLIKEFKRGKSYKHESFMGIMRWKLYEELKEIYKSVSLTYGYITKHLRINSELDKSHRTDALCITGNPNVERIGSFYQIKQVRKKKRSLHEVDPRKGFSGVRRNRNMKSIIKKDRLWSLWDKVKLDNKVGWISGFCKPCVYVKDVENKNIQQSSSHKMVNPSKLELINRNNNWIYKIKE